jgi:hypothetical protein
MNWIFRFLFPNFDTTVRIKSGHLPGLKAPTIAPRISGKAKPSEPTSSNIQLLYARYKAEHPNKPQRRSQEDRGVGF